MVVVKNKILVLLHVLLEFVLYYSLSIKFFTLSVIMLMSVHMYVHGKRSHILEARGEHQVLYTGPICLGSFQPV